MIGIHSDYHKNGCLHGDGTIRTWQWRTIVGIRMYQCNKGQQLQDMDQGASFNMGKDQPQCSKEMHQSGGRTGSKNHQPRRGFRDGLLPQGCDVTLFSRTRVFPLLWCKSWIKTTRSNPFEKVASKLIRQWLLYCSGWGTVWRVIIKSLIQILKMKRR